MRKMIKITKMLCVFIVMMMAISSIALGNLGSEWRAARADALKFESDRFGIQYYYVSANYQNVTSLTHTNLSMGSQPLKISVDANDAVTSMEVNDKKIDTIRVVLFCSRDDVYDIEVSYVDITDTSKAVPMNYYICRSTSGPYDNFPIYYTASKSLDLACTYVPGQNGIGNLPKPRDVQAGNTKISVILERGHWYYLIIPSYKVINNRVIDIKISEKIVSNYSTGNKNIYNSKIPSSYISMHSSEPELGGTAQGPDTARTIDYYTKLFNCGQNESKKKEYEQYLVNVGFKDGATQFKTLSDEILGSKIDDMIAAYIEQCAIPADMGDDTPRKLFRKSDYSNHVVFWKSFTMDR